ncbi:hypothetical protein [Nonomuraea gerenzanensis]|uniref:Uncharacterized protein n=1 Tax=Nonomuraea gerenzanensis TaxID=93944 RepID=A0A1M4DX99_9ACTN|nr:hypothetical protein [Nonomuraea gerenzanensis]UBU13481.1 hypothetical protein LCN96_00120 [Nonomuraea gerenzanensis]SBO91144.1 hypothetical protein BN4615_P658 [Nonomuraea gerenzanensis]
MYVWEPHVPTSARRVRVTETSCCGEYEWCCEARRFFVLRHVEGVGYEETGRGRYPEARQVWIALVTAHEHKERRS